VPGSLTWGHPFPRLVTWARFERRDGRRFVLLNTHLPYRDEDESARERGARLIVQRIAAIAAGEPVVLTGDFNCAPDSRTHAILGAQLHDVHDHAPRVRGPAATFHGFSGKPDRRIDWILVRGFAARRVDTVTTHRGALYPSDHFPVVADLRWPAP
jgi:endonuclease/exonuclease/phosphatase family metal-dependent hydrolase